jgi:hypothetical protein
MDFVRNSRFFAIPALVGLFMLAAYWGIVAHYRLAISPGIDQAQAKAFISTVKHSLGLAEVAPTTIATRSPLMGPTWLTLYARGKLLLRLRSSLPTFEAASADILSQLNSQTMLRRLPLALRKELRIKLDLMTGRGPVLSSIPLAFSLSLVDGIDGLGAEIDGREEHLLPDDLFREQLLGRFQPMASIPDFHIGVDIVRGAELLQQKLNAPPSKALSYFRFRTQSWVDDPQSAGEALPVVRLRVPMKTVTRTDVRRAVISGADFVLAQMRPDGRFTYRYFPLNDEKDLRNYNFARHAGTTWFLAVTFKRLRMERHRNAAAKAVAYLANETLPPGCNLPQRACVGGHRYSDVGTTALALVAIAEYHQISRNERYLKLARRLAEHILWMQKENGDFCHHYFPDKKQKKCDAPLLYASGEAVLALAKYHAISGDKRLLEPMEKGLDFLTKTKYDHLVGQFFISEDHWTCIAAEAAIPAVSKLQYAKFCGEFVRFGLRAQIEDDDVQSDLAGTFNVAPFIAPNNAPPGSRTEANVATYHVQKHHGLPTTETEESILAAVRYLVDQMIRPVNTYLFAKPKVSVGAMMETPVRPVVRVDYVQHAAAALVIALPLIPQQSSSTP